MANYDIQFKKPVVKGLRDIPNKDVKKILERIDTLAVNPRCKGCIKLSGQERYRVRQGAYRVIYEVRDAEVIVLVVKIAHRAHDYKSS